MKITTKRACVTGSLNKSWSPRQRERHRTKSAFGIFVHFLAVSHFVHFLAVQKYKTTTWNDQVQRILENANSVERFEGHFFYSVVFGVAIVIAKTPQYSTTQATNKEAMKEKKTGMNNKQSAYLTSLWLFQKASAKTYKQTNEQKNISPYLPQLFIWRSREVVKQLNLIRISFTLSSTEWQKKKSAKI